MREIDIFMVFLATNACISESPEDSPVMQEDKVGC